MALIDTNAAALAALVDKTTGDALTAAEYTTLKDALQEANTATRTANRVFASPDGSAAAALFRALVAADIPALDAAKITSGVFPIARLATGTPDGTKFIRDDGVLATPAGGGGTIDGSGSTDTLAKWSDADTLAPSKVAMSGANGGTLTVYDPTASTGASQLVVREGPGQAGASIFKVLDASGAILVYSSAAANLLAKDLYDYATSGAKFYVEMANGRILLADAIVWRVPSGGGAVDVGLARSAAGELKVTDGAAGLGDLSVDSVLLAADPTAALQAATKQYVDAALAATRSPSTFYSMRTDFAGGPPLSTSPEFMSSISGTGAGVVTTGGDPGKHPGIAELGTGTTAAGIAAVRTGVSTIAFGFGVYTFETQFMMPVLSTSVETFTIRLGFSDSSAADPLDGAYLRYTHGVNSGKFQCVTRNNSAETATDSTVTAVAGTWYRLSIVVNAAATSVSFTIGGVTPTPNTTNIPSGNVRVTGLTAHIAKSGTGVTERLLDLDYMYWSFAPTTPTA